MRNYQSFTHSSLEWVASMLWDGVVSGCANTMLMLDPNIVMPYTRAFYPPPRYQADLAAIKQDMLSLVGGAFNTRALADRKLIIHYPRASSAVGSIWEEEKSTDDLC